MKERDKLISVMDFMNKVLEKEIRFKIFTDKEYNFLKSLPDFKIEEICQFMALNLKIFLEDVAQGVYIPYHDEHLNPICSYHYLESGEDTCDLCPYAEIYGVCNIDDANPFTKASLIIDEKYLYPFFSVIPGLIDGIYIRLIDSN